MQVQVATPQPHHTNQIDSDELTMKVITIKKHIFFSSILLALLSLAVFVSACNNHKYERISEFESSLPQVIDYNFDVRPILSDNCFACHGPDMANQKAGLRLDTYEGATKALESGAGQPITPGKLSESQAFLRMISEEKEQMMPPPESHLELSDKEIAIIAKWIEQGAIYKPHWAFEKPVKKKFPNIENENWIRQPIDYFILNRLDREGLKPSESASKETLIRRVSFDLTGLPPGLNEINDFLNDTSSEAYEKLVDRLLTSPAYGEHMAANWMDISRYADSDGYLDDKHRDFSPWRNWVIEAFNKNMPYDKFITWQLAGDLIPEATKESTLATAFNRLHKKNSEAGIVFEEYRVEYVADRTNTLGAGIMGLSLECARCHDHKYDPISQKNYFELFAFFNSTFEIGTPVYGPGQVPGPSLLLTSQKQDLEIVELKEMIARLEQELIAVKETKGSLDNWVGLANIRDFKESINKSLTAYYPLDKISPTRSGKEFLSINLKNANKPARLVQPLIKEGIEGNAFYVTDYNKMVLGEKIGWFDRTDDFSLQLALKPDTIHHDAGILWHSEDVRLGLKGYSLYVKDNRLQFIIARSWPQNAIQVTTMNAIPAKKWSQVSITYNGSSKASGVAIYIDGTKQDLDINFDNLYKSILFEPDIHTYGFEGITLGTRGHFIPFKNGGIDEIKVFNRKLSDLEVLYLHNEKEFLRMFDEKALSKEVLKNHYFSVVAPNADTIRQELKKIREKENEFVSNVQEVMVMGDLPKPRATFILNRGVYSNPTEQVYPSTPESILAFKEEYPKNRLGLTKWLFDEDNPLTSRVYVNRIWQMHFGAGIVKTAEDFGAQGSMPSHPDLLSWLAVSFMENGWNIKALHKMIVMSATYMQDSRVKAELLQKDPENSLLARGPRYRMSAEMIRDNALAISGLLEKKQGGESVYPYQPEGIWDGLTTKSWAYKYLQDDGEGLYRRSLYTIWKRQSPPPFMQIFDVSDRGACSVRRKLSSTPLQALALLNDPQFVEASRVMAEELIAAEPVVLQRLNMAFQLLTGRIPSDREFNVLNDFYKEELDNFSLNKTDALAFISIGEKARNKLLNPSEVAALGVVISSIMNTAESYTKK